MIQRRATGKPKIWRSWRVCPECGTKATKLFNIDTGKLECQVCGAKYDPPNPELTKRRKSKAQQRSEFQDEVLSTRVRSD